MIETNKLDKVNQSLEWKNEAAKNIVDNLIKSYDFAKKKRTIAAWSNALLFIGQVFRDDNFNVTLIAACASSVNRLEKEYNKRIEVNKAEPTEAKPKPKATQRRGRRLKEVK